MTRNTRFATAAALLLGSVSAFAQSATEAPRIDPSTPPESSPVLVDRIVAIVDEEPILQSDLQAEVETYRFEAQTFGRAMQESPDQIRAKMLDRLVEARLLIAQAKVDGVLLEPDMLEEAVAEDIQGLLDRYGSLNELERDLANYGMDMEDLRSRQRELNRLRFYTSRMMERYIRPRIEIREGDLRDYFEQNASVLPAQADTVGFLSVLVAPRPSEERRSALEAKLEQVQAELDAGADFAALARKYSQGPMAASGGELPAFGRGELFDPRLEEQAWGLEVGSVTQPIFTDRGVHLLKIEARDEQVHLRQIMFTVQLEDADRDAAQAVGEQLAEQARSGQSLAELARSRATDSPAALSAQEMPLIPLDQLSPEIAAALQDLRVGEAAGPLPGEAGWFVFQMRERREGRQLGYDDLVDQIRGIVTQQKMESELERFIGGLRDRFYIEIKA
ncbi:MAG TPA: peptidylprolyl isomerase [Candidatus Krumholzibacteria bacterium]|jgi:peptidyl-prolyl cis-trans isomerase SurA